jgi:hypothetical protein
LVRLESYKPGHQVIIKDSSLVPEFGQNCLTTIKFNYLCESITASTPIKFYPFKAINQALFFDLARLINTIKEVQRNVCLLVDFMI